MSKVGKHHDCFEKIENIDLIDKQNCELISDDFRREQKFLSVKLI